MTGCLDKMCISQEKIDKIDRFINMQKKEDQSKKPIQSSGEKTQFFYGEKELYAIEASRRVSMGNFYVLIEQEVIKKTEIFDKNNIPVDEHNESSWSLDIVIGSDHYYCTVKTPDLYMGNWIQVATKGRGYLEDTGVVKRLFRKYINYLVNKEGHTKKVVYKTTGWKKFDDGKLRYVIDEGVIGYPELSVCSVSGSKYCYDNNRVGTIDTFEKFWNMRNIISKNRKNGIFLQYYLLLSTLTSIFQKVGFPIKFLTALIGKSNTLKTTTGLVMTKLFDRSSNAICNINFQSTKVAIIESLETYSDAIVMIDDLTPADDVSMAHEQASCII